MNASEVADLLRTLLREDSDEFEVGQATEAGSSSEFDVTHDGAQFTVRVDEVLS